MDPPLEAGVLLSHDGFPLEDKAFLVLDFHLLQGVTDLIRTGSPDSI